jgi:hypothetical protein
VWRKFFTIAGAIDDDLVAGIGQAVQDAVTQDGVIKESQPLLFTWTTFRGQVISVGTFSLPR